MGSSSSSSVSSSSSSSSVFLPSPLSISSSRTFLSALLQPSRRYYDHEGSGHTVSGVRSTAQRRDRSHSTLCRPADTQKNVHHHHRCDLHAHIHRRPSTAAFTTSTHMNLTAATKANGRIHTHFHTHFHTHTARRTNAGACMHTPNDRRALHSTPRVSAGGEDGVGEGEHLVNYKRKECSAGKSTGALSTRYCYSHV